jgi:hypothetical protein
MVLALGGAAPAFASGSYSTFANSNIRLLPSTGSNSTVVATVPGGGTVTIDCYVNGQSVGGTSIWDHRVGGGYISDSLLNTGSNNAVVPWCSAAQINMYPTFSTANIRAQATTASNIVTTVGGGTWLTIDCYSPGQLAGGTTIWDHVVSVGFVSDSLLNTGSNGAVVPVCQTQAQIAAAHAAQRGIAAAAWARANYKTHSYPWYITNQCTWFVSTALAAAGLPKSSLWTTNSTDKSQLSSKTFGDPGPTKDFTEANDFVNYMVSAGYATRSTITWSDNTAHGAQYGDIIAYYWHDNSSLAYGTIEHVAMVTGFTSQGYPTVTQMSGSQTNRFWSWSLEKKNWIQYAYPGSVAYLIHFVK